MNRRRSRSACAIVGLLGCWTLWTPLAANAQFAPTVTKADAPLVVDGIVRQIYTHGAQPRNDYLIEIEVRRADARKAAPGSMRSHFPAPAELMYVHIAQQTDKAGRAGQGDGKKHIPEEGQSIRAYLRPRAAGGWQEAISDWFELNKEAADSVARDEATAKPETHSVLGMTTEPLRVENRTALRVTSVTRGGQAQNAGLEVGDIIAGINDDEIKRADELTALAALGEKFSLMVIDVNSGKVARIEIDPVAKAPHAPTTEAEPAPPPKSVSLGMSAEAVTLGTRSALKVIRVDPAGVAAKAGLEPGDIVVAANGAPTTSVEQLLSALRKSGPTLNLTVRDTRTGRDTEVAVELGTTRPVSTKPVETSTTQSPGKLGAVTELAFHDSDFAVKVTEVTPGSPAARAGLKPGVIITAGNGKPVLHPNDLNDLVRASQGALKLTVVDPASGRKSTVDVNLGR